MGDPKRRVTVVGPDDRAETLREAVRDAGGRLVAAADPTADAAENAPETDGDSSRPAAPAPDATLAVGEDAVRNALTSAPTGAVIPVGTRRLGFGVDEAASRIHRLFEALDSSIDGIDRVARPVLSVSTDGASTHRAAADVALITEEAARISEFSVRFPRGCEESFRADGVVVATPFGSDGYANAVGGPIVEPGGGLSVVPVAPFSTHTDPRIAAERVTFSVERETEPVALVVDGAVRATVDPHRPIEVEVGDRVDVLVPEPRSPTRARRSETL